MTDTRVIDEIREAELTRLARLVVDLRATRAPLVLLPISLLVALRPNAPRIVLLGAAAVFLVAISHSERRRFHRLGYAPSFIWVNAAILQGFHSVVYLTTGGLGSPILPLLVGFSIFVGLLLGRHPTRLRFAALQIAVIWLLAGVSALGWDAVLTPTWFAEPPRGAHAVATAAFTTVLVVAGSRMGVLMRALFDRMLERTAEARQDLLQEQREQAEQLTALSGEIAHELKNPLASVKGLAGLLARDIPDGRPAERLAVLRREVDRMQGILEEFLNFSRPAVPLSTEEADLGAVCADVASLHEGIARERGVRLRVTGTGLARVDVRKTRQILINLVQNAIDASPSGAEVAVVIHPDGRVTVEDEGTGLDPAVRAKVFEAGVTTKPRGSGLGLTIARGLARQQGGELDLADRERGCVATVRLPRGAA